MSTSDDDHDSDYVHRRPDTTDSENEPSEDFYDFGQGLGLQRIVMGVAVNDDGSPIAQPCVN